MIERSPNNIQITSFTYRHATHTGIHLQVCNEWIKWIKFFLRITYPTIRERPEGENTFFLRNWYRIWNSFRLISYSPLRIKTWQKKTIKKYGTDMASISRFVTLQNYCKLGCKIQWSCTKWREIAQYSTGWWATETWRSNSLEFRWVE